MAPAAGKVVELDPGSALRLWGSLGGGESDLEWVGETQPGSDRASCFGASLLALSSGKVLSLRGIWVPDL